MPRASWIAITLLISSIATSAAPPIYRLADGRIHPEAAPHRLTKLVVVGIADDQEVRHRFEDKFATHLRAREIGAVTSYSIVPDLREPGDRQRILDELSKEKVDGALTIRAVPLDDLDEKAWGEAWSAWADAPSTVRDLITKTVPVPKKKAKRYGIEIALWDVETAQPLWAARTAEVGRRDLQAGVGDLLQLTIDSLKDTPWLGPNPPAGY